jgi:N4-gp56 family major capsid protein
MAYPNNNNTDINSELFSLLVTEAQFAAYEQSVARQLVTVFDAPLNTGRQLQVPIWSSITAQIITDEAAATIANTNTTSATITLSEHVVYHQVTDMLRDSAYQDVFTQLGDQSGRAIAQSMDTQVFTQFANLSGSSTAIAVANLTVDDIMDRVATLRTNKLTGPFYAVLHPQAANQIKKAIVDSSSYTASGMFADSILQNYFIGQIAGCQIFESSLVPYASGTGIATCGIFAASALGHGMRGGIDMNMLYLPANRATDVVLKAVAGAAVLQSTHGVIMNVDLVA